MITKPRIVVHNIARDDNKANRKVDILQKGIEYWCFIKNLLLLKRAEINKGKTGDFRSRKQTLLMSRLCRSRGEWAGKTSALFINKHIVYPSFCKLLVFFFSFSKNVLFILCLKVWYKEQWQIKFKVLVQLYITGNQGRI